MMLLSVISGFRRDVDEICALLDFLTLEDGTDTSSGNVGKGLALDAA
jgi:hypothetical protein